MESFIDSRRKSENSSINPSFSTTPNSFFTRFFLHDFEITRSTKKNTYSFLHHLFDLTKISKYVHNFIILKKFTFHSVFYTLGTKIQYNYGNALCPGRDQGN